MFKVLGLRKTGVAGPGQKYELILKDLENQKPGYVQSTEYGTEGEIRAMLKGGGLTDAQIDVYFVQGKDRH
jgi:hypothetical protein